MPARRIATIQGPVRQSSPALVELARLELIGRPGSSPMLALSLGGLRCEMLAPNRPEIPSRSSRLGSCWSALANFSSQMKKLAAALMMGPR